MPPSRNLTVPLGEWLRRMGFTVLEQGGPEPSGLEATWRAPDDLLYQLTYVFAAGQGVLQLLSSHPIGVGHYGLVHKAEVSRLRECRFLLTSNVFYREARQQALSAGTLQPTH